MLKAISLFTGIGGLDFGFKAAGFKTIAAVESDAVVARTLRLNTSWPVIEADINGLSADDLLATAGVAAGKCDILIAGPPCQPFSKAAYWRANGAARLDDPRARTLDAFLRVLEHARPRAFLLENVPGFAFQGKAEALHFIIDGVAAINSRRKTNYRVSWAKLNAADYGVPQVRERFFLVGCRDGRSFEFPEATHAARPEGRKLKPYHTAWDAIGDLPARPEEKGLEVKGKWAELLPSVPEGQNYLWHTNRGGGEQLFGWRTRYWSFLLKLAKDQPAWTIQSQTGSATGPFHWSNRKLSTRELLRLQTIPDALQIDASRNEMQRMIGNAVPSLLAELLAREIRRQLFGDAAATKTKPKLMPIRRSPAPKRHPVRPVPEKFRELIGEYADHPGPGLGVGAVRRDGESKLRSAA